MSLDQRLIARSFFFASAFSAAICSASKNACSQKAAQNRF
jgi:hypothetical protein